MSTTITIQPALKDTTLVSWTPTTNYGTHSELVAYWPSSDPTYQKDFLISFDFSSQVPDGATITSATLSLYRNGSSAGIVTVYRLLRTDWVESEATWNIYKTGSNWTTPGALSNGNDYTTTDSVSVYGNIFSWVDYNVTNQTQTAVNSTGRIVHFLVMAESHNDFNEKRHWSSNYTGNTTLRPKLSITYTEPQPLNVFNSISISENLSFWTNIYNLNVYDSISVSENLRFSPLNLSVHDSVLISENLNVKTLININVFDNIAITTEDEILFSIVISIFDDITTTEEVIPYQTSNIDIHDHLRITEDLTFSPLSIDVFDVINVSETKLLYDDTNLTYDSIFSYDGGTTSPVVEIQLISFDISFIEDILISEEITIDIPYLGDINALDILNLTDNFESFIDLLFIDISDTLNLTDNFESSIELFISIYDDINLTEEVIIDCKLNDINIYIYDRITSTEEVIITYIYLFIDVSDTLTLTDNFDSSGQLTLNIFDDLTITEIVIIDGPSTEINVSDALTITETVDIYTQLGDIDVSDTLNLRDNFDALNQMFVSVGEDITCSDVVNLTHIYHVGVSSDVIITELVTLESFRFSPSTQAPIGLTRRNTPIATSNRGDYEMVASGRARVTSIGRNRISL